MGKTVSKTDIGLKRELNQDYVFTAELPVGKLPNLYLVADGMGGHKAGGYASKYAVETIVEVVNSSKEEDAFSILYQAIVEANYRIRKKASEDESMTGMGTTLVAATVMNDVLRVANVGDSRLYLVNEGMILYLLKLIYSLNKYLCGVPGTVVGNEDTGPSKADKYLPSWSLHSDRNRK